MSPKTLRMIGLVMMLTAAIVAVLNLKRVANLGMIWLPAVFIALGAACFIRARGNR